MAESRLALKQLERGSSSGLFLVTNGSNILEYQDFDEYVDDRVNALLVEGSNITLTYNDVANTLTIAAASGGVSTTGTPANNQISVFTNSSTIEGTSRLTFDDSSGSVLTITNTTSGASLYIDHDATAQGIIAFEADGAQTWSIVDSTSNDLEITGSSDIALNSRNIQLFSAEGGFGSSTAGQGVLKLGDVTTAPVGTLTGGGSLLYVSGTDLIQHDDAGNQTILTTNTQALFDESLGADGDWEGDYISATAGSGGVGLGDVCFMDSSGAWRKAKATLEATTSPMLGIALNTATATNSVDILLRGTARMAAFPSFSGNVSSRVYLDTISSGDLTTTKPSGAGEFVRVLGYAMSADALWFDPEHTYYEI